ncbi:MAG: hypothetical protein OHK0052_16690 [Anaerolineales bacterium]
MAHTFLEGPAGSGKTTTAVERMLHMLESGIPGHQMLIVLPQRTLAEPYETALQSPTAPAGGSVDILTLGGLARRSVELFWQVIAEPAGFAQPHLPPTFLTLETAQYYMAHLVRPLFYEGYFESVNLERNRIYSQILDNLNKAAEVGFDYRTLGERLKSAWSGDPAQLRVYEDMQDCANRFRTYCLQHNLLDFSLQLEIFTQYILPTPQGRAHLLNRYRHWIVDNLEENPPILFDLLASFLPELESALLIYDHNAGYRTFLGADPQSALALRDLCQTHEVFSAQKVCSPPVQALAEQLSSILGNPAPLEATSLPEDAPNPRHALAFEYRRYFPEMLDWVVQEINTLVQNGLPPGEIVVLAPYLSDALRFALLERLNTLGIPARSQRPSRPLREEPATQSLLNLLKLAHPEWGFVPTPFEFAYTLLTSLDGLDLVRARLFADVAYRSRAHAAELLPFGNLKPEMQHRLTFTLGERYERLRLWLEEYRQQPPEAPDYFLSRLFGEVLSQRGFGFHTDWNYGEITANLIESIRKFRQAVGGWLDEAQTPLGREYLLMVQDGVIAAQYVRSWRAATPDAVLLAPAYTFVMQNRPVQVQFWLDVGGRSWGERLEQPLTQPYVLSRQWQGGVWSDADDVAVNRRNLHDLSVGLLRRCRERVYLGLSMFSEQGYEQRGALLRALDTVLRRAGTPS